jgi:hypothetical protein
MASVLGLQEHGRTEQRLLSYDVSLQSMERYCTLLTTRQLHMRIRILLSLRHRMEELRMCEMERINAP